MDLKKQPGSLDTLTVQTTEGSSPHHQAVIQSFFELPWKLEFGQSLRLVGALPAQHVGAYGTADTQLTCRLARFELALVGQNLLQPHHAEFAGDPGSLVGIKRSVYAKVTWRSAAD
jgi:hypothetical protein